MGESALWRDVTSFVPKEGKQKPKAIMIGDKEKQQQTGGKKEKRKRIIFI